MINPETGDPAIAGTDPIPAQMGEDSSEVTPLDISPFFTDVDGEPLMFTASNLPEGLVIDPDTGIISGTPVSNASQGGDSGEGVYTVTLTATDPDGESVSTQVTYSLTNPAPVAMDDGVVNLPEDGQIELSVLSNDTDDDVLEIAEINGEAVNVGDVIILPSGAELEINPDFSLTYSAPADYNGPDQFSYTVSDGNGDFDTAFVDLNVNAVNDGPQITANLSPQNNVDGQEIIPIDVSAGFTDIDGDDLRFIAEGLPPGLVIDAQTGIISGVVDSSASVDGPYSVTITAVDPSGATITSSFLWTIDNVAPIVIPSSETGTERQDVLVQTPIGDPLSYNVQELFEDPDGDILSFRATGLPEGLSLDPETGEITGIPTVFSAEPVFVTVTVDDGEGGTAQAVIAFQIDPEDAFVRIIEPEIPDKLEPSLTPYQWVEDQPIEIQEWFKTFTQTSAEQRTGHTAFLGGMVLMDVPGYAQQGATIIIEAVVYDDFVNVQLGSSLDVTHDKRVTSWVVTGPNAASLPNWVDHPEGHDMVYIQKPLNQEVLEIEVKALLDDGRAITNYVQIEIETGIVTQTGEPVNLAQTLGEHLSRETRNLDVNSDPLAKALATG